MRKTLLNLHMYTGLLFAPYFVVFGISSLNFNHHFISDKKEAPTKWSEPFQPPEATTGIQLAERTRDQLKLLGWPLPWNMHGDRTNSFDFAMEQPAKSYHVFIHPKQGTVEVSEERKGFWNVLNSLHGARGVPNSAMSEAWGVYTEASVWAFLFATASGIWLWAQSKRERRIGAGVLAGSAAASIGFMLWVILAG